jgi:hypothetical protein
VLRSLLPYALLTLLWLLFFQDLVCHPGWVLYSDHSDLLAEHIPAKRFLVHAYQETGELPRWCPYQFAGLPFLSDIQVAVFYPPHALFLFLEERHVGAALSWLLAAHVLLAGWLMHVYARAQGLGPYGSFVAAVGYMFAGKWLLHLLAAGHYILVGLAWLPLVLLCLEKSIRRGSVAWATVAGIVFALLTLGTHPQWVFYAGLLIMLWTLPTALEQPGGLHDHQAWRRLGRWLGLGAWMALVAASLCAVQLLPTAEASSLSIRSVQMPTQVFCIEAGKALSQLIGPAPLGGSWEYRGGFGVLWLTLAAAAPILCKGRVRYQAAVFFGLSLFALGGAVWLQPVPVFGYFRTPVRMFVLTALPLALLAGATTQALLEKSPAAPGRRRTCFLVMLAVSLLLVTLGLTEVRQAENQVGFRLAIPYWRVQIIALPALFLVLLYQWRSGKSTLSTKVTATVWALLLLADLWSMNGPLARARTDEDLFAPSECVRFLINRQAADRGTPWRIVDQGSPDDSRTSVLGTAYVLAPIHRLEGLGGYNPLDLLRTRQFLQFVGGSDQPVRPLEAPLGFPALAGFPLREKKLLDLLGVRFLLRTRQGPWPPMEGEAPGDWHVVAEDEHARAFNFARQGLDDLPPYVVLENRAEAVFPRAFVVPEAKPLPEGPQVRTALKDTDFRRTVLLEDWQEEFATSFSASTFREARVLEYQPNRIRLQVPNGGAGWLVLTDVWYPGWVCKVDGQDVPVHRANYLFRAVPVSAGSHDVVFRFEPRSYRIGRIISSSALLVVAMVLGCTLLRVCSGSPSPLGGEGLG